MTFAAPAGTANMYPFANSTAHRIDMVHPYVGRMWQNAVPLFIWLDPAGHVLWTQF